jgi:hypothetical protein
MTGSPSRFTLPPLKGDAAPEGYSLPLTLALVETLEQAGGGLLQLADRLLRKDLPLAAMVQVLCAAYRFAGCAQGKAALEQAVLENAPPLVLADLLLAVLTPLHAMGAVAPPGE